MSEDVSLISLALQLQSQGDAIKTMGETLKAHLVECADARTAAAKDTKASNERLGARIWAVCLVLLSGVVSMGLWEMQHQTETLKTTAAVVKSAKTADDVERDAKLDTILATVKAHKK